MKTIEPFTPLQYIIGNTKFYDLDFVVDERVFIPRPETELLVRKTIDVAYSLQLTAFSLRILDLCTGSGNIAIALTKNIAGCKMVASDISDDALRVARQNAESHGASDRIEFVKSDLFQNIAGEFDIIATNPPYKAKSELSGLQKEVLAEPRIAIDGGEDGLDFYRRMIPEASRFLKPNGALLMEIGYGQVKAINDIIKHTGALKVINVIKDFNNIDRVIIAQWIN